MKTCIRCHETKPRDQYHRQTATSDGLRAYCKACVSEMASQRRKRNPNAREAELRRARERRDADPHDGASPRIHPLHGCLWPGCKRDVDTQHLCDTHHHEVTKGSESPLALVGGRWEKDRAGVRRWVA